MRTKVLLSILIAVLLGYYLDSYLHKNRDEAIANLVSQERKNVTLAYHTIMNTYTIAAQENAYYLLKDPRLLSLLRAFDHTKSPKAQARIRGQIYRHVYPKYRQLKQFNIAQLNFHTPDGKSLLRMNAPDKNGDDVMQSRPMVRHIVLTHEAVSGFEGGRLYAGYRHLFPIIDKGQYLGSVEFGNNFDVIRQQLQKSVPKLFYELILTRQESYDKVFEDHRPFFVASPYGHGYYVESEDLAKISQSNIDFDRIDLLRKKLDSAQEFQRKFLKKQCFALPVISEHQAYVVTFTSIKNIDGQHAGYLVSYGLFPKILHVDDEYSTLTMITLLLLAVVWFLILFVLYQFDRIKKHSNKLQHFLDTQNSIVVLTDGDHFKYANEKFIEFFAYPSLKNFLAHHDCICELFLDYEEGFSLKKVKAGEASWIESLLNLPPKERRVYMNNQEGIPEAFAVFINRYDATDYVVNFHNINEMILELRKFHTMAVRDPLTGVYNRLYYESMSQKIIEINQRHAKQTGVIFFDIDHFKKINDLYGHNVGDSALIALTALVQRTIRKSDVLIRWGGEEFIILIEASTIDDVHHFAENLRQTIARHTFETIHQLTVSFGVSLHTGERDLQKDISLADERMYCAKQAGRNQVCKEENRLKKDEKKEKK